MRMDLSMIICTYDRSKLLSRTIDCLTNQVHIGGFLWELLIIDNNSTDNTKVLVSHYQKEAPNQIRYIFEPKQGKNFALNTGIRKAKGKILAFTDDDVIIANDWIKNIIENTNKYSDIGFGGRVLPKYDVQIPSWITMEGKYRISGGVTGRHDWGEKTFIYARNTGSPPIGANMFFRKEAFAKYGLFREDLRVGTSALAEDMEFCQRLLKLGENLRYIPEALIYHPVDSNKLKKHYFRKHWFNTGMAHSKYHEVPLGTVYYFRVPRFYYRSLLVNFFKFFLNSFFSRYKAFYYQLKVFYYSGLVYSYFKGYNKQDIEIQLSHLSANFFNKWRF